MSHHGAERADACEVVAAVPAGELLEEREQPTRVGTGQAHPEAGRILDQALGGAQLHGTQPKAPCTLIRAIDHTSQVRLLLVEDDVMIGEAIRAGLKREGFVVDWVHDAEAAARVLRTERIEHLGVVLDPASHRVTRDGVEVSLSPREFALLQLLLERPGVILSRAQIEERLYGWGEEVESNAVEVHIHGLRRKLGAQFILTVRGVGYRVRPAP